MSRRSFAVRVVLVSGLLLSTESLGKTTDAEAPLAQLGRLCNWHLTYARDPYDELQQELGKESPDIAARALLQSVTFPADSDAEEKVLLRRFHDIAPKALPSSLQKFLKQQFEAWSKQTGTRLKLQLVQPESPDVVLPYRGEKYVYVPVAVIGRDWLRAVRDDGSLFRLFMWSLSHPQYASSRPSKHSADFALTGACSTPFPNEPPHACGGDLFYRSHDVDIAAACKAVEQKFAANLRTTLDSAAGK